MPQRVGIIGCGPCGMSALYHFGKMQDDKRPDIVCFEKQSTWGGLWNFTWKIGTDENGEHSHSGMYRNLWSNGPKESIEYPDYTFEEHFGKAIPFFSSKRSSKKIFRRRGSNMTVLRHLPWLLSMFIVSSFAQDIPEWDFFTFTQQWPQSVCIVGKQEGKTCKIPKQVDYWTIHGLWPSDRGHERPKCPEVKFDPNLIKDLMVNLNLYWPDMYNRSGKKPSDKFKFWSDEWKKHGSCARSLPATKNERLYFAKSLELRQKYDLLTMLKKCNIVPSSTRTYTSSNIANCYKKALGVSVEIRCINDKKKKRADFAETRLHLDKKFVLINIKTTDNRLKYNYSNTSTKGTEGCPRKGIYFLPIEH